MSFISYLEDIEKVRDELLHLAQVVPDLSETDVLARQRALKGQVENITRQLDKLLDLATDPQIALADDLKALRSERARLETQTAELASQLDENKRLEGQLKSQLKDANHERRRAERAFEKLATEDFGAALDAYSPNSGQAAKR